MKEILLLAADFAKISAAFDQTKPCRPIGDTPNGAL
jgi:hypothetical protein